MWGLGPALRKQILKYKSWSLKYASLRHIIKKIVWGIPVSASYTAKTQFRTFETNCPREGIARPPSCVCDRFLYSLDWSAYSAAGKRWTDPGNI
jgi:hypothetical protein